MQKGNLLLIFIYFFLSFCNSCKKGTTPIPEVQIHYMDKVGNDLFTNGQNGYYKDSVAILNLGGDKIPNYVDFVEWAPSTLLLQPSIYTNIINNYCSLVIYLRNGVNDTLKMHLTSIRLADGATLDSIWYNGRLKKAGTKVIDSVTNPDLYATMFTVVH